MSSRVELAGESFDPAHCLAAFERHLGDEGAIVSFTGRARGTNREGERVTALVLESYRGVTLASMKAIAADAHAKFAITQSHIVHRAGRIMPQEAIVFVAAASLHRRAAFQAADYLMDRLKTEAIFWKREEYERGARWIEPREKDFEDAGRWA